MKKSLGRTIWNNVLFGALIITPIIATFFVLRLGFNWITGVLLAFIPAAIWSHNAVLFRFGALLIELVICFLIGALVKNILGKRLYQVGENMVTRIPLMSKVYLAIRQIMESFFSDRKSTFSEVVALEYPRPGLWSIGFVTSVVGRDITDRMKALPEGDEFVSVFVPTAPNPTTGWLCIIERSNVRKLPFTPGEGMKLVLSAGAAFSGATPASPQEPTFLDKVDAWMAKQGDDR
jgi:uncharacterized membrane protein